MGLLSGIFGGKPKVDDTALRIQQREARLAREREERRKKRIDRGMGDIASIFEGGRYKAGIEETKTFVGRPKIEVSRERIGAAPGAVGGENFDPAGGEDSFAKIFTVGDKTFDNRKDAAAYRKKLSPYEVTRKPIFERSKGVNPYLRQRRQALEGFYNPQLLEQSEAAQDDVTFALSRAGLTNSTVASDKKTELQREQALAAAKIAADIDSDIANTQSRFEQQRQALEAGLRASGDRSAAAEGATRAVANIQDEAPSFSILPDLFSGVAQGIGQYRENQQDAALTQRINDVINPMSRKSGVIVN